MMKRINNTPNFHTEVMTAIIDFLILIRYSQKWQWIWIHNAQLMLQVTLSHVLSVLKKINLPSIDQKLGATYLFWHINVYLRSRSQTACHCLWGFAAADPEHQVCEAKVESGLFWVWYSFWRLCGTVFRSDQGLLVQSILSSGYRKESWSTCHNFMSWWSISPVLQTAGKNAPVSGLFQQVVMYLFQKYTVS